MKKIGMVLGLLMLFLLGLWMHFYQLTPFEVRERTIQVHLEGEVKSPGLYEIKEEERLSDLLERAGGLTDEAEEVNLARKLLDGEKIVIHKKRKEQEENEEPAEEKVRSSSLQSIPREKWLEIPGIGPVTADAILDFLKENPEAELEDLHQVKGIGEKKLEQIRRILGKE